MNFLKILGCQFINGYADANGANGKRGSAILLHGPLVMDQCMLKNNFSQLGGPLFPTASARLKMVRSIITKNESENGEVFSHGQGALIGILNNCTLDYSW